MKLGQSAIDTDRLMRGLAQEVYMLQQLHQKPVWRAVEADPTFRDAKFQRIVTHTPKSKSQ